jgi:hypothetical protein
MTCQELRELFELYALGVLEAAEHAEIDVHLARNCPTCSQALAHALALNAGVLSFVAPQKPSRRLRRRLLAAVGYHYPGWGWVWAMSATLALIVALWIAVQERQRTTELAEARRAFLQISGERDRLSQALQFLADPQTQSASFGSGPTAAPRGFVLLHPQLGVLLVASNLPAAPPGKTYEMWVIPKGGTPLPAGLFPSDGAHALHILTGPLDMTMLGTVTVTLEPAAGSNAPTSAPVIVAPLGT